MMPDGLKEHIWAQYPGWTVLHYWVCNRLGVLSHWVELGQGDDIFHTVWYKQGMRWA